MKRQLFLIGTILFIGISAYSTTVNFSVKYLCENEETVLMNTSTSKDSIIAWKWDLDNDGFFDDASGQVALYKFGNPGIYTVGLKIYTIVGDSAFKYKSITIYQKPAAAFNVSVTCSMDPTQFTNLSTVSTGFISNYIWDFGDGMMLLVKDPTHLYGVADTFNVSMIAITDRGCKDTAFKNVIIYPTPEFNFVFEGDTVFYEGEELIIKLDKSYVSYLWSTGSTKDSIHVSLPGVYTVTVTDNNTCKASLSQRVTVLAKKDLESIDLITPNGDGKNDVWFIKNTGGWKKIEVNVYNRIGDEVFADVNYKNTWDGSRNGNPLPPGPYFYIIKLVDLNKVYKGTLNIIR